jgi:electron transport complex protein RnfG
MNKTITIIKTTVILFIITSVSALLLAFVNEQTAPLIKQNESIKQSNALKAVMPDAADFEESEIDSQLESVSNEYGCEINNVYIAKDSSGAPVGVCSIITGNGYDSGMQIAVGVDSDLNVTDLQIIASNETPGLGQNASKPEFKDQYKGKTGNISVVKSGAGENQINAISGATLTSEGVTRIVNAALKIAQIKGGN